MECKVYVAVLWEFCGNKYGKWALFQELWGNSLDFKVLSI